MSRHGKPKRSVSINLTNAPEILEALDSYMIAFGLDSRSQAATVLLKMGLSSLPAQTMVYEVSRAQLQQLRETEFAALTEFFVSRARLFAEARR